MRITGADLALATAGQPTPAEQPPATTQTPAIEATEAPQEGRSDERRISEARRQLWSSDPLLSRYTHLLERMFAVDVRVLDPTDLTANGPSEVLVAGAEQQRGGAARDRPELAITMNFARSGYVADNKVQFSSEGRITTPGGRQLDVEVTSRVDRTFLQRAADRQTVDGEDPLVLQLDALPSALKEAKVELDLGRDGTLERLLISGAGAPYLAWDVNGDGKLDGADQLFPGRNPAETLRTANSLETEEAGAAYLRLVGGTDTTAGGQRAGDEPEPPTLDLKA